MEASHLNSPLGDGDVASSIMHEDSALLWEALTVRLWALLAGSRPTSKVYSTSWVYSTS